MVNAHVISNKCYFLGRTWRMPNPFAGPKIALPCSIFYEYMIHYNFTLQNIMLYHTEKKIFEYGQKYLTAFIIIFPWSRLFWTSRWIGQKFEFWISNKEGEGRRSRKSGKKYRGLLNTNQKKIFHCIDK